MKKIIIIPAYNESESIKNTVGDIVKNAKGFDYIIINDCSTDDTAKICRENKFNYLDLPVNLGIGGAVQTGYMYAYRNNYDVAVQVDGDGQHNALYLNEMADTLVNENLDMVIGSRFITNEGFQSSGMRRFGIWNLNFIIKILTGKKITDCTSGMRMVNKDTMKLFANEYPKDYPEPESLVYALSKGRKVKEIPVIMNERTEGVSSISPLKSIYYMVKVSIAMIIAKFRR